MKMRRLIFSVGLIGAFTGLFGQQAEVSLISADDAALNNLPRLVLPVEYATRPLPFKKDNSKVIYFSGIYNQQVWNCNQASSIWTMFTYEINYLRNLSSSVQENQFSPMAVYNLLNYGIGSNGVSYFDSWNLIKANGIPGNTDFSADNQNSQIWMTGYDKYYRGMKNRVDEVFAIDVGNPEGLLTLKHWINDHLNGAQIGGLANFQIGSGDMVIPQIPLDKGLDEEGQYIITKYGPYVGHAMTFVGWNDSVRFDVNGDGRYTNDIDINGDGEVTMKDWEIGAMLVVNSWGSWGNAGKIWVMYRLLAEKVKDGGIWNNVAMVVKPKKTYNPLLTVKAAIRYNERNRLKIQVGVSSDLNAVKPEQVLDFPCFNFQGDALPMQGFSDVNSDLIEIGLDITPLLNYIPDNGQAKVFLEVVQKSPGILGSGRVESFSVMDYSSGTREFASSDGMVPIISNTVTRLSVDITAPVTRPLIVTEELPEGSVGVAYRAQLEADGTTSPYRYKNPDNQYAEASDESTVGFTGGTAVFTEAGTTSRVMDLPFAFPFYGNSYNKITILSDGGIVMGSNLVIYPYVIDGRLRFYQNAGVYPLFGTLHYRNSGDAVTFAATATEAIVRWRASVDPEGLQPVEFAAKLLPNGKVSFYYGHINISADVSWISGVSAGNNLDYYLMSHNSSGIQENTAISIGLINWPAWLNLGTNGDLSGTPDKSGTYTIPLKVTDWNGISNSKELVIQVTGGNGVETGDQVSAVRVWPNPASNDLWLEGNVSQSGTLNFLVFDLTGRQLISRVYAAQPGHFSIHCTDIKDLKSGVYLYRLSGVLSGQGKLVKQD